MIKYINYVMKIILFIIIFVSVIISILTMTYGLPKEWNYAEDINNCPDDNSILIYLSDREEYSCPVCKRVFHDWKEIWP